MSESTGSVRSGAGVDAEIGEKSAIEGGFDDVMPSAVLELAKKAVLASREAAILAESHSSTAHIDDISLPGSASHHQPASVLDLKFLSDSSFHLLIVLGCYRYFVQSRPEWPG